MVLQEVIVLFFEVNKNWDIEDVLLHLNFSKSQILNGDVSSLTVLINNVPIKSIKLNAKTNYKNTLEVLVPKDYIIQGYNEIKVKHIKQYLIKFAKMIPILGTGWLFTKNHIYQLDINKKDGKFNK